MHGFIKLLAILGQFERSAHLCALRTFFIRHKLASTPVRGNLLISVILGFLQLPPVGKENKLVGLIVRQIDFRFFLQGNAQRTCGTNQLLQFLVKLLVLPGITSPPARSSSRSWIGITTSHRAPRVAAARVTSATVAVI